MEKELKGPISRAKQLKILLKDFTSNHDVSIGTARFARCICRRGSS